jgi:hypothetical protein
MTKVVQAHDALPVNHDQAVCASEPLGLHGGGNGVVRSGQVHTQGKGDAVLVQERLQGIGSHGFVMLKHGMQAQHHHLTGGKKLVHFHGLRQALVDASRAQPLKGMNEARAHAMRPG